MVYSNEMVKDYILRSFVELMRTSGYLKSYDDSLQKTEIWANPNRGYVEITFFGREQQYDDETKWVKIHERKIGAGEILRIMETENVYESTKNKKPIGDYAWDLWKEWMNARDAFYEKH